MESLTATSRGSKPKFKNSRPRMAKPAISYVDPAQESWTKISKRAPQQYQVSLFIQILQVLHLKTDDLLFPAAITKRCRYWDELHPVMSMQTCANPPVTRESTDNSVPDLLGTSSGNEEEDLPPPFNPPEPPAPQTDAGVTQDQHSTGASTPTNCSGTTKRKSTGKGAYLPNRQFCWSQSDKCMICYISFRCRQHTLGECVV